MKSTINLKATYDNLRKASRDYGWLVELYGGTVYLYDNIYSFICRYIISHDKVKVTRDNVNYVVPEDTDIIWKFIE